jgi:hypothetical protein
MEYLEWGLKSIQKFARGFDSTVLVVAKEEEAHFNKFLNIAKVKTYDRVTDPVRWQINAQAMKCMADTFCDSDFILHTDSDCVFTEPVTPDDYFVNRKPVMLIRKFATLQNNPWREPTERALGFPCEWETMARHPQVNPRRLYNDVRSRMENLHHKHFVDYVLVQKADFPWGFSEHCTLGAFAHYDPYWHGEYHWIDTNRDARPKDKLYQAWSHSPPNLNQALPHGGSSTPLELYRKLEL